MVVEDITDEIALKHARDRIKKIPPEVLKGKRIVLMGKKPGQISIPLKEALEHMEKKDEIGKLLLEIEKNYLRWEQEEEKSDE